MALTFAKVADGSDVWGKTRVELYDVTLDSSYPAGGEAIVASDVGLRIIDSASIEGGNAAAGVCMAFWDRPNGKLMVFYPTGGGTASPAALADPISTTGGATASAVDATTPNITPGQAKEVLAATDLSTFTFRMRFFGN